MINRLMGAGLPLRIRLVAWFTLFLGGIALLFGWYLSVRLEQSLLATIDTSLQVVAVQAMAATDYENNRPNFQNDEGESFATTVPNDYAVRLFTPDGNLVRGVGEYQQVPLISPLRKGYLSTNEGDHWRLYTAPLMRDNEIQGWMQVAQSLESVDTTVATLRLQLWWGIPFVLIIAAVGGLFVADRALRPITTITHTAARLEANDLSQRIGYKGPQDEVGALATTFDSMLARLQRAFEQERRFTADTAHELRTPLTILKGQLEVTRSRRRTPEQYEQTLDTLTEQVERLIHLATDLLFLTRLDQKRVPQSNTKVDLTLLLCTMLEQLQPLAYARTITLSHTIKDGLTVQGDSDRLTRLFLNILENALRYTLVEGTVRVNAHIEHLKVVATITDTGIGIPEKAIPHLFERFYRVDDDRARASGGTGLGLAIAAEIAHQHWGSIDVKSALGKGSTFTITLPYKKG